MVDSLLEARQREASAKAEAPTGQQLTSEKGEINRTHGR